MQQKLFHGDLSRLITIEQLIFKASFRKLLAVLTYLLSSPEGKFSLLPTFIGFLK